MGLHSFTWGAATAALLACSLASAQTSDRLPGFDLERLDANIGHGTLLVGNGELLVPGGLSINLVGHYQRQPLALSDGTQQLNVVGHRATGLLGASYGVLPWLELGAQVPVVLWQQGDDPRQVGLAPLTAQGLGTPVLQARLGLLSQRFQHPVDMTADVGIGLPAGTQSALAGDAGLRYHARMTAGVPLDWLWPSLEVGVLFRPSIPLASMGSTARPGAISEVHLAAAVATTGKGLRGDLNLRALLSSEGAQIALEMMGGVRFPLLPGLDAFVLGGPGIGSALGTPRFRVLGGVAFRSEPPPKISLLDEEADRQLQVLRATREHAFDYSERPLATPSDVNGLARAPQTPSPEQDVPPESRQPHQLAPNERLVLSGEVIFDRRSDKLSGVVPLLDQVALRYYEQPASNIIIEGYSDAAEGTGASGKVLSLQRAMVVRRYLAAQTVPWPRMQVRGLGADYPVSASPATEAEHQLNRRVKVLLVVVEEAPVAPGRVTP